MYKCAVHLHKQTDNAGGTLTMVHATIVSQLICTETDNLAPELQTLTLASRPYGLCQLPFLCLQMHISINAISQMQTWQRDDKLRIAPVCPQRRLHISPHAHCL